MTLAEQADIDLTLMSAYLSMPSSCSIRDWLNSGPTGAAKTSRHVRPFQYKNKNLWNSFSKKDPFSQCSLLSRVSYTISGKAMSQATQQQPQQGLSPLSSNTWHHQGGTERCSSNLAPPRRYSMLQQQRPGITKVVLKITAATIWHHQGV